MADEPEAEPYPRSPFPERKLPGPPDELPMDVDLLKVLASDSRRDILRLLRKRRMTLTELAAALDLKKATVLEHLKKLTDASLIRRIDDERLWVYYELTHRGGRIVNPARTRFYLLMGVAAAALVLGGVVAAAVFSGIGPLPGPGFSDAPGERSASTSAPTGGAVSVDVSLDEPADAVTTRAYLLTASDAQHLREGDGAVVGIPLAYETSVGDVARFRTLSGVPPGSYFLYVVDEDGRDNLASLAEVRVPSLAASGPDRLWRGLDGDATFSLARDGTPADGTLLLVAGEGHELPTVALANGTGTLDATTLDRLVPAEYGVQYLPEGSRFWISLDKTVDVREPLNALDPLYAFADAPTTFRLGVTDGERAPGAILALDGEPLVPYDGAPSVEWTTTPDDVGRLVVQLGRLDAREVEVLPDHRLTFANESPWVALTVRAPSGDPVPELAVGLGSRALGLTDANGTIRFTPPADGAHELRLVQSDGLTVHRAIRFEGLNASEEPDRVRVRDTTAERNATGVTMRGTLANEGAALERVTLALDLDGRTVASRAVESPGRSNLSITLSAPVRLAPGEHALTLRATPLRHAEFASSRLTAFDGVGTEAAREAVVLNVEPPTPILVEHVTLEPRSASGGAADEKAVGVQAPAAETPGVPVALVLGLVAGIALARRRLNRS